MKILSLRTFGYLLGAIGLVVAARSVSSWQSKQPLSFKASPELVSVVDGNTAFALDLYRELKGQPGNLFFSPHSISTCLAMTYAGARGQTEKEMAQVLHFNLPQANVHNAFARLTDRMNQVQRDVRIQLLTANSLWYQRTYKFDAAYVDLVRGSYRAEAKGVDFTVSGVAGREINAWVNQKTRGNITEIIDPYVLDRSTALVLCNAIYFKGKWAMEFDPGKTRSAPFQVTANDTVTVPMMSQKSDFKMTYADDGVQLIDLPYSGRDLSMVVLLPNGPDGLEGVERKLTAENLRAWLDQLDAEEPEKTSVSLPRFMTRQNVNLVKPLKALGMESLFSPSNANLSGMDPTDMLYVSDAVHAAFVDVNEAGTEAAAATAVTVMMKGMTRAFYADHPFIFLIRERGSGTVLFLGRLVNPN